MPPKKSAFRTKGDSLKSWCCQKGFILWLLHIVFYEVIVVIKKLRKQSLNMVEDVDVYLVRYREREDSNVVMQLCRDSPEVLIPESAVEKDPREMTRRKRHCNEFMVNSLCDILDDIGVIDLRLQRQNKDGLQSERGMAYINSTEFHERKELEDIGDEYLKFYASSEYLIQNNIMIHSTKYGEDIYTQYITDERLRECLESELPLQSEGDLFATISGNEALSSRFIPKSPIPETEYVNDLGLSSCEGE